MVAKLVVAVPSSMTKDEYYPRLCPQVVDLVRYAMEVSDKVHPWHRSSPS